MVNSVYLLIPIPFLKLTIFLIYSYNLISLHISNCFLYLTALQLCRSLCCNEFGFQCNLFVILCKFIFVKLLCYTNVITVLYFDSKMLHGTKRRFLFLKLQKTTQLGYPSHNLYCMILLILIVFHPYARKSKYMYSKEYDVESS